MSGSIATATARADRDALAPLLAAQQLAVVCEERVLVAHAFHAARAATRALVVAVRDADLAHVAATRAAIEARGGRPAAAPGEPARIDAQLAAHRIPGRPTQLRGLTDALTLLIDLERSAIGAAYVAVAAIQDGTLAGLVASMMASDAQHQALIDEQAHPGDIAGAIPLGIVEGIT